MRFTAPPKIRRIGESDQEPVRRTASPLRQQRNGIPRCSETAANASIRLKPSLTKLEIQTNRCARLPNAKWRWWY
jgi:hypothetical protein